MELKKKNDIREDRQNWNKQKNISETLNMNETFCTIFHQTNLVF